MKSLARNVGRRVFCELMIFTLTTNAWASIRSIGVLVAALKMLDISYHVKRNSLDTEVTGAMLLNIAKIILMFLLIALMIAVIYGGINAILWIFFRKDYLMNEQDKAYYGSKRLDIIDSGVSSIALERKRAIKIAHDLYYGSECISKIKAANSVAEINRILQTYREAM